MKKKLFTGIFALLGIGIILTLTSCSNSQSTEQILQKLKATPSSSKPGNLTLSSLNEKKNISLSQYKGSLVYITFWISSCKYCNLEAPLISQLGKLAESDDEIQIIGISRDTDRNSALAFIDTYQQNSFPNLFDPNHTHEQVGFPIKGTPTTYIISPSGDIVGVSVGYHQFDPNKQYKLLKNLYKNLTKE